MNRLFVLRDANHLRHMIAFIGANWEACSRNERPLQVQVGEYKAKRSLDQNAAMWAMLSDIAEAAWVDGRQYDREVWHRYYADKFLPKIEGPGGKLFPVSTTTLSVAQMSEYLDRMQADAASELGVQFGVAA